MSKIGQREATDSIHMQPTHAAVISRKSPNVREQKSKTGKSSVLVLSDTREGTRGGKKTKTKGLTGVLLCCVAFNGVPLAQDFVLGRGQ